MHRLATVGGLFWLASTLLSAAEEIAPSPSPSPSAGLSATASEVSRWPTERLTLKSGRVYRGWVKSEGNREVRFTELVCKPGRPISLMTYVVAADEIARLERLDERSREALQKQVEQYLSRHRQEKIDKDKLSLQSGRELNGRPTWRYGGKWIALLSTADEATVRAAVVRLEYRFAALRQLLPVAVDAAEPMRFILWGSRDEYFAYLKERRLSIANPAIYIPKEHTIVAYSDLGKVTAEMARIREEHKRMLSEFAKQQGDLKATQRKESDLLRKRGATAREIADYQQLRSKQLRDAEEAAARQVEAFERRNQQLLDDLTDQTFRYCYHEAFHAYLDLYIFPEGDADRVPRWLNEGLAQVFEVAGVDGTTYRLDASPARQEMAKRLAADLASEERLTLAEVMSGAAEQYLAHAQGDRAELAERMYLYAWGLADYLTFEHDLLQGDAFAAYTHPTAAKLPPVARFEAFVKKPLGSFESEWRQYIVRLAGNQPSPARKP